MVAFEVAHLQAPSWQRVPLGDLTTPSPAPWTSFGAVPYGRLAGVQAPVLHAVQDLDQLSLALLSKPAVPGPALVHRSEHIEPTMHWIFSSDEHCCQLWKVRHSYARRHTLGQHLAANAGQQHASPHHGRR